ncbi:thiamine phosphate synthase [Tenacibaculum finnmarkense]|uniref:Thiamine phosphate pyrophosphorylase n=1 Tax=Tenacibaculum finnmarkense genomovar ulcerans TaxID=2781388 RepID=A0A2I2LDD4_9FLAO|nr:thiamine phosphate synthase [Tenacibaculum finnmarkense]MBE7697401.1 thiamine phosphate synthase [Tenacibaculum finnmarkense genomovar ulcerans]MCD8400592.1 thiamine phosphate synthase [Tenacibaculum finnmarkense genomovar ulcerans]MCD8422501.1 thiamine phosphate synthase [Tenacibaculum finnmarkense genomovar ulcerans]MCG8238507.1 thiamine phosphate synthase [Tenacibaculum finnmarkense genomovar ulcerans]MCG8786023.1 thiamine phosphate synthase [Tenacibaculum finnmarkense]
MIVLISPEKDVANEMQILHQLFEAGLECYHLRKPSKDYQEHIVYLNQIPEKYHNKIVTHYFHELVNEYSLKGIHFQEQKRRDALENGSRYFIGLQMIGKTMSSSFHEPEELANCDIEFDYHLLSPVFSSISKKGYQGRGFDVNHIDKTIIGMGGITSETISKTLALGFQGIGVLGGVWNSQNAVESFKKIQKEFDSLQ